MRLARFSVPMRPQEVEGRLDERTSRKAGRNVVLPAGLLAIALATQAFGSAATVAGGLALFLAGLPHGIFGDNDRLVIADLSYALRYICAGVAAALTFLILPVPTLALFLGLSAWHFMNEKAAGTFLRRTAIACLAIGGSALWRPDATQAVFAALCGAAIPGFMILLLGVIGLLGHLLALARLARRPSDAALLIILASPALLHPVLATGVVFVLGHAGPVSREIARRFGWGFIPLACAGILSPLVAAAAVYALPLETDHLPFMGALAVAVIMPHLLPQRWLLRPCAQRTRLDQSSQSATSPAT